MKLLTKVPVYHLRSSSKTKFKLITQNIFHGPKLTANINYSAVCDTSDTNFPHLKYSSEQEEIFQSEYKLKKNILSAELCEECCLTKSVSPPKKIGLLNLNIEALNDLDILPSLNDVIKNMLSYLEPFPFVTDEKVLKGSFRRKPRRDEGLTISILRNSIERQYLAWKFQVSFEMIERILRHLRWSFYEGRSLQSLKRNLEILNEHRKLSKIDMSKQLYLLSQMAFNINILEDFQDNIFGLDWFQIGISHPRILHRPYLCLMLRVKALQEEGFSTEQLKKAFPLLDTCSLDLMKLLGFFKDLPHIYKYRDDPYFLRLLLLFARGKLKDSDLYETNYEDLKSELSKHERFSKGFSELIKIRRVTISLCMQMKLGANEKQLEPMKINFSKYTFSLSGLSDTLLFLQENKFTTEEIIDCITIIFYPRQVIQRVLNILTNEKRKLKKFGFVNGRIDRKVSFFESGSKLRNKTLHLCLYYIQKPNNFSVAPSSI